MQSAGDDLERYLLPVLAPPRGALHRETEFQQAPVHGLRLLLGLWLRIQEANRFPRDFSRSVAEHRAHVRVAELNPSIIVEDQQHVGADAVEDVLELAVLSDRLRPAPICDEKQYRYRREDRVGNGYRDLV